MSTLPEALPEGSTIGPDIEFIEYPTVTYYKDPITKQLRGTVDGLEAMTQAVEIILSIERYKFQIYTPNDGVEFEGLLGNEYGFVTSELKRRITDAFVPDIRILGVEDFTFSPIDPQENSIIVTFTVRTVYGYIPQRIGVALG